jgi:hypothetical protein
MTQVLSPARQELHLPMMTMTCKELCELRDRSGLSRQEFYLHRIAQARFDECAEVGGI